MELPAFSLAGVPKIKDARLRVPEVRRYHDVLPAARGGPRCRACGVAARGQVPPAPGAEGQCKGLSPLFVRLAEPGLGFCLSRVEAGGGE
eukprot:5779718-Lingulodinium_polyedra.AAC.1